MAMGSLALSPSVCVTATRKVTAPRRSRVVALAAKTDEPKGFLGFKADWLLKDSLDLGAGYETDLKDTPFFDPKVENAKIPDGTKKGKGSKKGGK